MGSFMLSKKIFPPWTRQYVQSLEKSKFLFHNISDLRTLIKLSENLLALENVGRIQPPTFVFTTQSCSKPSFLFANWTIQDYCLQTWLQTKFTERRVG